MVTKQRAVGGSMHTSGGGVQNWDDGGIVDPGDNGTKAGEVRFADCDKALWGSPLRKDHRKRTESPRTTVV